MRGILADARGVVGIGFDGREAEIAAVVDDLGTARERLEDDVAAVDRRERVFNNSNTRAPFNGPVASSDLESLMQGIGRAARAAATLGSGAREPPRSREGCGRGQEWHQRQAFRQAF